MVPHARAHQVVPAVESITDFRAKIAESLAYVKESGEPLLLTRNGHAAGVLLDIERYRQLVEENSLMRAMMIGTEQAENGEGMEADQFLAELEAEG
jgi:prevent-host-death family protein